MLLKINFLLSSKKLKIIIYINFTQVDVICVKISIVLFVEINYQL